MRRIGPLCLALALCVLASLAAPAASYSALEPFVTCPGSSPVCYVDQDCNAFCQSACPATPRGACIPVGRFGEGFCGCRA
jgi:hypothetical protein